MWGKLTSVVVMTFLLGIPSFCIRIECALSVETDYFITIFPDGHIYPPTAPVSTVDNVTYVLTAGILCGITMMRNNSILDGAGHKIHGYGDYSGCGVASATLENVTYKNMEIDHFQRGIWLQGNSNVSIIGNKITDNHWGILITPFQNSVCSNSTISGNSIIDNWLGMELTDLACSVISGNDIENNSDTGIIVILDSVSRSLDIFCMNNIVNSGCGIVLDPGREGDHFYHNNFVNDSLSNSYGSIWDNGCEGNYWSGYNGTDLDKDGVGDTELPWMDVDHYPLMNPFWNPADINHDLKIDVKDIYKVGRAYGTSSIGPNPEGREWNPHCDINEDGEIDMKDYYPVCKNYGKTYP